MPDIKRKIRKALSCPVATAVHVLGFERTAFIPDPMYLRLAFKFYTGRTLDLKTPRTFNEKLQWLKLHDRKPEYTVMVDKVKVRSYVSEKIGPQYLIPCLGVWNAPDEIDFNSLPDQFVLKCNHNSGTGMCICKDKGRIDAGEIRAGLQRGLEENYFYLGREWPYKDVPRRIIGEKYLADGSGTGLKDYKVLCFHGDPKLIQLHIGRFTDHQTQDFYDTQWHKTTISMGRYTHYKVSETVLPKPELLDEMLRLSRILAKDIPHVRVDWYIVDGHLYFGELTFYDGSGFDSYDDLNDDMMIGDWLRLPFENTSG